MSKVVKEEYWESFLMENKLKKTDLGKACRRFLALNTKVYNYLGDLNIEAENYYVPNYEKFIKLHNAYLDLVDAEKLVIEEAEKLGFKFRFKPQYLNAEK